ncbi:MAG TPA: universal stress protein [Gemmatimonadales bacterium]|jgi:nucleotide-binding universal stress UspA family protein|nr:universal stress protein [Gemmatimonadales bacterium]
MYKRILVPLENGKSDAAILRHVSQLAKLLGSDVLLLHVADGWAARNMEQLNLRESQEMKDDRAYLERMADELRASGVKAEALLAAGDPAKEIAAAAEREQVDLIAMATHGHSLLGDVMHGTTATALRHVSRIPILMVRVPAQEPGESR